MNCFALCLHLDPDTIALSDPCILPVLAHNPTNSHSSCRTCKSTPSRLLSILCPLCDLVREIRISMCETELHRKWCWRSGRDGKVLALGTGGPVFGSPAITSQQTEKPSSTSRILVLRQEDLCDLGTSVTWGAISPAKPSAPDSMRDLPQTVRKWGGVIEEVSRSWPLASICRCTHMCMYPRHMCPCTHIHTHTTYTKNEVLGEEQAHEPTD